MSLREDEELRDEIQLDVDRCMQENDFFRQTDTKRIMLDVLFIFCKLNPDLSYRQGMHELLAPILWVVDQDAIDLGPSSKALGNEKAVIKTVYDAEHIEHDTFALFSQIMHSAKNFYEQSTHSGEDNPMVVRSQRIFNELLPEVDPALATHLAKVDIVPQVFLIRWIRLLFGREFAFHDVLTMWDVIFAEDASLELVDHVCLAMLLRIRWQLLNADYNEALTLLLRYPEADQLHPAQTFVMDALYLRDHMSAEGSGYLVLKYSGRPLHLPGRPVTPPALLRNITTFSGANVTRAVAARAGLSPPQMSRQRSNIEAIVQSTAKNIYARGEKFGIGKAMRSAVDEVHKRAQDIRDAQTPSLPSRGPSGGYGALYSKIKAQEERNKQLSALLQGAVSELWECQKLAADEKQMMSGAVRPDLERLSLAIAKVQFVEVYLADPSLPLPEPDDRLQPPEISIVEPSTDARLKSAQNTPLRQSQTSTMSEGPASHHDALPGGLADPSSFEDLDLPLPTPAIESPSMSRVQTRTARKQADAASDEHAMGAASLSPDAPRSDAAQHIERPALAESSYSWMLGQPDNQGRSFAQTNTNTALAERDKSRGFLFGGSSGDGAITRPGKRATGKESKPKAATAKPTEVDPFDLT